VDWRQLAELLTGTVGMAVPHDNDLSFDLRIQRQRSGIGKIVLSLSAKG
jgi:hypothetical protein